MNTGGGTKIVRAVKPKRGRPRIFASHAMTARERKQRWKAKRRAARADFWKDCPLTAGLSMLPAGPAGPGRREKPLIPANCSRAGRRSDLRATYPSPGRDVTKSTPSAQRHGVSCAASWRFTTASASKSSGPAPTNFCRRDRSTAKRTRQIPIVTRTKPKPRKSGDGAES